MVFTRSAMVALNVKAVGNGGTALFPFPFVKDYSTSTRDMKSREAVRAGWRLSSWSHPIGWLRSSKPGVVLQDDLQLLTQHDVPSNLQLTREERLAKQQRHSWVHFFFPHQSLHWFRAGWLLVVFKYTGSKTGPRRPWLTLHTNETVTRQVLGLGEHVTTVALAAEQWNNIHIHEVQSQEAQQKKVSSLGELRHRRCAALSSAEITQGMAVMSTPDDS